MKLMRTFEISTGL